MWCLQAKHGQHNRISLKSFTVAHARTHTATTTYTRIYTFEQTNKQMKMWHLQLLNASSFCVWMWNIFTKCQFIYMELGTLMRPMRLYAALWWNGSELMEWGVSEQNDDWVAKYSVNLQNDIMFEAFSSSLFRSVLFYSIRSLGRMKCLDPVKWKYFRMCTNWNYWCVCVNVNVLVRLVWWFP